MELAYLDVCLPDYFTGWHRPVMAIPVDGSTTAEELIQLIVDEYNTDYQNLTLADPEVAWPDAENEDVEAAARKLLGISGDNLVFPELPSKDGETPVLYLTVVD